MPKMEEFIHYIKLFTIKKLILIIKFKNKQNEER